MRLPTKNAKGELACATHQRSVHLSVLLLFTNMTTVYLVDTSSGYDGRRRSPGLPWTLPGHTSPGGTQNVQRRQRRHPQPPSPVPVSATPPAIVPMVQQSRRPPFGGRATTPAAATTASKGSVAIAVSSLLGRRSIGPGELQVKVKQLLTSAPCPKLSGCSPVVFL